MIYSLVLQSPLLNNKGRHNTAKVLDTFNNLIDAEIRMHKLLANNELWRYDDCQLRIDRSKLVRRDAEGLLKRAVVYANIWDNKIYRLCKDRLHWQPMDLRTHKAIINNRISRINDRTRRHKDFRERFAREQEKPKTLLDRAFAW